MNQTFLGLPLSKHNEIYIHPKTHTLKLPNITLQSVERIQYDGKISSLTSKRNLFLYSNHSLTIKPNTSEVFSRLLQHNTFLGSTVDLVEPHPKVEKRRSLSYNCYCIIDGDNKTSLAVLKVLPYNSPLSTNSHVARVTIITPKQAACLQPVNLAL